MPDPTFTFEVDEFEAEFGRTQRPLPPRPPSRPKRPYRPARLPLHARHMVEYPNAGADQPKCPTVLVLEGFGRDSVELKPHHEEMLKRLVEFIGASGTPARTIEIIGWGNSAEPHGATRVRRLERSSRRLEELLKAANRSVQIRGSVQSSRGPERVEVRLCV